MICGRGLLGGRIGGREVAESLVKKSSKKNTDRKFSSAKSKHKMCLDRRRFWICFPRRYRLVDAEISERYLLITLRYRGIKLRWAGSGFDAHRSGPNRVTFIYNIHVQIKYIVLNLKLNLNLRQIRRRFTAGPGKYGVGLRIGVKVPSSLLSPPTLTLPTYSRS